MYIVSPFLTHGHLIHVHLVFRAHHYGGQKTYQKIQKIRWYGSQLAAIMDYFAEKFARNMFVFSSFSQCQFYSLQPTSREGNLTIRFMFKGFSDFAPTSPTYTENHHYVLSWLHELCFKSSAYQARILQRARYIESWTHKSILCPLGLTPVLISQMVFNH